MTADEARWLIGACIADDGSCIVRASVSNVDGLCMVTARVDGCESTTALSIYALEAAGSPASVVRRAIGSATSRAAQAAIAARGW